MFMFRLNGKNYEADVKVEVSYSFYENNYKKIFINVSRVYEPVFFKKDKTCFLRKTKNSDDLYLIPFKGQQYINGLVNISTAYHIIDENQKIINDMTVKESRMFMDVYPVFMGGECVKVPLLDKIKLDVS